MFPDDEMLGIDLVYPEITYLTERADRLQAILSQYCYQRTGRRPLILPFVLEV